MSWSSSFSQRQILEDLWRERAQIALERYRIAQAECKRAIAAITDAAPRDGSFAYRQALRAENFALAEYRRVLTIFTDLTVSGKMPPQE